MQIFALAQCRAVGIGRMTVRPIIRLRFTMTRLTTVIVPSVTTSGISDTSLVVEVNVSQYRFRQ